jgi:transposase-like protein
MKDVTGQASRSAPSVINVDKNAAYPKAIAELKAAGLLAESVELRQVKYLNNFVEQDHRFIKRLVKPGLGFFSFQTAWNTLRGYESMNMTRKGRCMEWKRETSSDRSPSSPVSSEWQPKLNRQQGLTLIYSSESFCNTAPKVGISH